MSTDFILDGEAYILRIISLSVSEPLLELAFPSPLKRDEWQEAIEDALDDTCGSKLFEAERGLREVLE